MRVRGPRRPGVACPDGASSDETGTGPRAACAGPRPLAEWLPSRGFAHSLAAFMASRMIGASSRELKPGVLIGVRRSIDPHLGLILELPSQEVLGQRVLDVALDRAAQRTRAVVRVEALVDEEVDRALVSTTSMSCGEPRPDLGQLQVDDPGEVLDRERVEDDASSSGSGTRGGSGARPRP